MSLIAGEFLLHISVWDLVTEIDDQLVPKDQLAQLLADAKISVDFVDLCNRYIDETPIGAGDVLLFRSGLYESEMIALDLFRDPEDQQDMVYLAYSCDPLRQKLVAESLLSFFESCKMQVSFSMGNHLVFARQMISLEVNPRPRGEHGYKQKIIDSSLGLE
ncbi:hypothetical protein PV762_25940 [Mitsuaria sp. CC2]|uniref:hypothetical protein n=1 Tax=Mitsuaria sp. CC2 TaxID=3029186 RepID=UPI003B8B209B